VLERKNLPLLQFVKDDAWNLGNYGPFDAVFCCGLLYHLDEPRKFLKLLSKSARKLLILQSHFSTDKKGDGLSEIDQNEGIPGRWYMEYESEEAFIAREVARWSSWNDKRSFWIRREYIPEELQRAGFDLVFEEFDCGPNLGDAMVKKYDRSTFIGIKTGS
jgi:hypothetical protein